MDESTEQVSLDALQKENKELKFEIRWRDQNRKVWDFILSVFMGIFVYCMFGIVYSLAEIGLGAMAGSGIFTELGMGLWHVSFVFAKFVVLSYIMYHVVIINVLLFQDELRIAVKKLQVYTKAGREAVAKNREKIEEDVLEGKSSEKTEYNSVQKEL